MNFCDDCGSMTVAVDGDRFCRTCDAEDIEAAKAKATSPSSTDSLPEPDGGSGQLLALPTTDSGSVRKKEAMRWLDSLERPTDRELVDATVPKPKGFTGSTYPTSISNVRITGDPHFVETVAGLFEPLLQLESGRTRLEINLQETENRETGESTGNYALYLSVAER